MTAMMLQIGLAGSVRHYFAIAAALLYLAAFATCFSKDKLIQRISLILWIVGTSVNAVIVANNWLVNGYVPFVSMYQVLTFLGVTYTLVYIYIRYMHNGGFMKPYFILFQGVIMLGVFFMGRTASEWSFPPALQSAYFVPHVFSYMISYTLVAVAALLAVISFFVDSREKQKFEKGIYHLVLTGFPFMVLGMFLGALWANACWGNYWSWDNKEVWSLVTVLSLTVYLHFRRQASLSKYAKLFVILAFLFEIITLFFVGMFGGDSVHAYN
ncbi:MAG: cytochrome c biogenesis protein CcsA [Clostridia bacterium]|nr:cytochrome c biogenesis protein CcsA [Clostridia bacterium]